MKFTDIYFRFLLFLTLIIAFSSCNLNKKSGDSDSSQDTIVAPPKLMYGLPIDSFEVVTGAIKSNEYLGSILNKYDVSAQKIDQLAKKSDSIFDVRKIRSGKNYALFMKPDSTKQPLYFVYESSKVDFVVYELFDSLNIYTAKRDVTTKLKSSSGIINSSLWNAMVDNDLDPTLAIKLADIFQWTIDFFAIDKGDKFRVIYDEIYVDSTKIGIGKIHAVQFDHRDTENYAIGFKQDERFDYFDEKGQSLRKAFLKAPLKFSRISSRFSNSRLHPVLRIRRPHHGVDYAAPTGTPVVSIGDGTVIKKSYQKRGAGRYVKIKHNSVYTTVYMHFSKYGKDIKVGSRVKQNQVIGYVGASGLATGPHLDFRVYKNGKAIDPLKVKAPPVEPVKEENLSQYTVLKDSLINQLHYIDWQKPVNNQVIAEN